MRRFITGDLAPPLGVALAVLALGIYTALKNDFYFTEFSIQGLLALFAVLAFAAMAQRTIMITGGIDLSVGPAMSLLVVIGSFWLLPVLSTGSSLAFFSAWRRWPWRSRVLNWAPTMLGHPAFVVTLVMFTAFQGVALYLRPTPDGFFDPDSS